MASEFSSYDIIDPFLMAWAKRYGIRVATKYRDDDVRSIWVYDKNGNSRAQMWLDLPDVHGNVTIVASELDPKSATKWGAREERHASPEMLQGALEELRLIVFDWAGEGAFT
ncbi:hypothetical protein NKG60_20625 [Mesorhizobium sp. M1428]|uniref:hypothetical protein n=1 Tax=unclassified Mesorhizobium TaxID=325217 RepID=UPI00333936E8